MQPARFKELLSDVLLRLDLGQTPRRILGASIDPQTSVEHMISIISDNPFYAGMIEKLDFLQKKRTEWMAEMEGDDDRDEIILERMIRLIGVTAARNAVLSLQLNRQIGQNLPRFEGDRWGIKPNEQLKYAIQAENYSVDHHLSGPGLAFQAGFHWDLILNVARVTPALPKTSDTMLSSTWLESIKIGEIAYHLSGQIKNFEHGKDTLPAALLLGAGKILTSILYSASRQGPNWAALITEVDKHKKRKHQAFELLERKRLSGDDHGSIAALLTASTGLFSGLEPALFNMRHPYVLRTKNKDLYRLARILQISTAMFWDKSFNLRADLKESLSDLMLTPKMLEETYKRTMESKS